MNISRRNNHNNWKTLLFMLILTTLVNSCGQLPIDQTSPPIDNNLWTLELSTSSTRDVGLIGTSYYRATGSQDYLDVPLIKEGVLTIRSQRCLYESTENYKVKNFSFKRIAISELMSKVPASEFACVFNIGLFVKGMDKGFQGQLFVQIKEVDEKPLNFKIQNSSFLNVGWYQFRENSTLQNEVSFPFDKPGNLIVSGCGLKKEITFIGAVSMPLKDLIGNPKYPGCVFTLGVKYADGEISIAELNIKIFKEKVLDLPNPVISYAKGKLSILADTVVAYSAINDHFKRKNKVSLKVKKDEVALVRIMSANGRYKLLKILNGEIIWTSSVQY